MSLQSNKQTSLVLSGGGVRGMAHIGFIKALQDNAEVNTASVTAEEPNL